MCVFIVACNSFILYLLSGKFCVGPKKHYTKAFETLLPQHSMGATITHAARTTETPPTTVHRVVGRSMTDESRRIQGRCEQQTKASKGHRYNTGLHNLRGGTFLDVIPGHTVTELRDYYKKQPI